MSDDTTAITARIIVDVSADRMAAHVHLEDPNDLLGVTSEQVLGDLQKAKVVVDDKVTSRVQEFLQLLAGDSPPSEPFLVAEGKPPVEGRDAELAWSERLQNEAKAWRGDAPVNYYKTNSIVTVQADEPIGTLQPAVQGEPGCDVHGKPIKPKRTAADIELDDTVARSPDNPGVLIAKVPGRVVLERNRLSISEALELRGDVDFESGSIESSVDVQIGGMVHDGFEVKSTKSVTVRGAIQAADVEAGADVTVCGGILGRNRGHVRAAGDIVAKFGNEANLHAGGGVSIQRELMNCEVRTEGKLLASHATVIGGRLYAKEGVEVASLGSDAGMPTLVIVGIDPEVLAEAGRLDGEAAKRTEAVAKIRETVQPLLANQKRLSASQKERATELLYEADTMEEATTAIQERREQMLADATPQDNPYVLVSNTVYPKVTIQIGRRQTLFHKELKGPVRIEQRKVDNVTEFVAVNQLTGSETVLSSSEVKRTEEPNRAPRAGEGPSANESGR